MAGRPQGVKPAKGAASALVLSGSGNLYSLFLSWRGVTAGDRVAIVDGTDATGTPIEEIILNEANNTGVNVPMPAVGKAFGKGLYVVVSISGGELNWSAGYDGV